MVKNKKALRQKSKIIKKNKSKAKLALFQRKKFNWLRFSIFVLVFAAVGGTLLYISLAANFNTADENVQYAGINKARLAISQPSLPVASCLNTLARDWSKTMAAK